MTAALLILSSGFILTISLMVVSLRGSILNDGPRKPAQYLIYILLGEFWSQNQNLPLHLL
jgi:hypothetical protein